MKEISRRLFSYINEGDEDLPEQIFEDMLETDRYCRIRIGIGSDFSRGGQIDFVLGDLSEDEMKEIPQICERVIEGIKAYSTVGPQRAMNSLNTRQNKANALENEENK